MSKIQHCFSFGWVCFECEDKISKTSRAYIFHPYTHPTHFTHTHTQHTSHIHAHTHTSHISITYPSGWGRTESGIDGGPPPPESAPKILQQVRMPVISNSECKQQHLKTHQFCGGNPRGNPNEHVAACSGDSGGPFVCKVDGRWVSSLVIGRIHLFPSNFASL